MRLKFRPAPMFETLVRTSNNVRILLPQMMQGVGLTDVFETRNLTTVRGSLSLYRGTKP